MERGPGGPVRIPEYFAARIAREFGAAGRAWLDEIPGIVERCRQAWRLCDCLPIEALSINFVCFCTSAGHGDAVLKIQGPHSERFTEIEALRLYDGRHCCRLMALDLDSAAMLLQRARPGTELRRLPDRARQLEVGTRMIAALPVELPARHGLPPYSRWLDRAAEKLERAQGPGALREALETARELYRDTGAESEPQLLLHGDLHHDNILRSGADDWVAVDPQGVTGARFLEAGRFIQNHVLWGPGPVDEEEVTRTIQYVAEGTGESWTRIARALYVLHALSTCWSWEGNEERVELDRMCDQCSTIESIMRRH